MPDITAIGEVLSLTVQDEEKKEQQLNLILILQIQ
jgi:hypothetical protein